MKVFSRFISRVVNEVEELQQEGDDDQSRRRNTTTYPVKTQELGTSLSTCLTVWRKSLVINCEGFTVIDSRGNLVYRVDNYIVHPDELILMDSSGKCIYTMRRRRKLGLVDSWFVYEGEISTRMVSELGESRESPVCCVRKRVNILYGNPKVQAYVYRTGSGSDSDKRHAAFTVEGSYAHRTCKVLDESKNVVAEIKRKETNTKDVSFGIEIFHLLVHPGFDPSFAMALVLLLDQMFS